MGCLFEFPFDLYASGTASRDCRAVPGFAREWQELRAREERNLSELLQHEIDHLDGIFAVDRIIDMRTMCTREEFEKRYRGQSPMRLERSRAAEGDREF